MYLSIVPQIIDLKTETSLKDYVYWASQKLIGLGFSENIT